jgi:hypothetical protein
VEKDGILRLDNTGLEYILQRAGEIRMPAITRLQEICKDYGTEDLKTRLNNF